MTTTEHPQTASGDHGTAETQGGYVAAGLSTLPDHGVRDAQSGSVGEGLDNATIHRASGTQNGSAGGGQNPLADQATTEIQVPRIGKGMNTASSHLCLEAHGPDAGGGPTSLTTKVDAAPTAIPVARVSRSTVSIPTPIEDASTGTSDSRGSQRGCEALEPAAVAAPTAPEAIAEAEPTGAPPRGISNNVTDHHTLEGQLRNVGDAPAPPGPASAGSLSKDLTPVLADPLLALAADVLDDLERVRIANENRLRQLTRDESDKDGEERGFGLTLDHPDVARLSALVDGLVQAEKGATKNLELMMRRHPLAGWVKAARGVGDKQAARLLAAIGDPFWNDLYGRPRLVSELWSYCGYGDAAFQVRRRGEKARWSAAAKMRTFNVAESTLKQLVKPCHVVKVADGKDKGAYDFAVHVADCACSRYRVIYDEGRTRYRDSVHPRECVRCGPKGKPAPVGSPRSAKHQHQAALRLVSKAILRDLWLEAKRIHEFPDGQAVRDPQGRPAVGDQT